MRLPSLISYAVAMMATLLISSHAQADGEIQLTGCPCQAGQAAPTYAPAPLPEPMAMPGPGCLNGSGSGVANHIRTPEAAPPPGTLGRTYQLPARLIPATKHPRVGMLDVVVTGAVDVVVISTNEFREEDAIDGFQDANNESVWRFETKPLIPGIPHVYRVEVYTSEGPGVGPSSVQYVRMIPGRIIGLSI